MDRKKVSNIVVGVLLIVAGILALGQVAGYWQLAHLLSGWWTLFLIVPALTSMITTGLRPGNICLMLLGFWLFAGCQGWLGEHSWTMLVGIALVIFGVGALTGWGKRPGECRRHRRCDTDSGEPESKV